MGTVATDVLKQRAERLAYAVKGVRSVDNKITVAPASP
jgi:osmotically-inducible protein OsmY